MISANLFDYRLYFDRFFRKSYNSDNISSTLSETMTKISKLVRKARNTGERERITFSKLFEPGAVQKCAHLFDFGNLYYYHRGQKKVAIAV